MKLKYIKPQSELIELLPEGAVFAAAYSKIQNASDEKVTVIHEDTEAGSIEVNSKKNHNMWDEEY